MAILKRGAPASRRALLATSFAAASTGLLAAPIIAPDAAEATVIDPHPVWMKRWLEVYEQSWDEAWRYNRQHGRKATEAIEWEHLRLERLIATTPAKTARGARAQMELLSEASGGLRLARSKHEPELAASIIAFLEMQGA